MIKVGLTGGIGSGKTYITHFFNKLGIAIYNSDTRGKHLMDSDPQVKNKIIEAFGSESYNQDGLNRKYLSQHVFNDNAKLATINQIVHPAVKADFENWCSSHKNDTYIIKEAAILIESGAYKDCDYLIVVTAPTNMRIQRVIDRDNMTPDEIKKRMAKQLSDDDRLQHASFTINNDGTMLVEEQVVEIHNQLLKFCIQN